MRLARFSSKLLWQSTNKTTRFCFNLANMYKQSLQFACCQNFLFERFPNSISCRVLCTSVISQLVTRLLTQTRRLHVVLKEVCTNVHTFIIAASNIRQCFLSSRVGRAGAPFFVGKNFLSIGGLDGQPGLELIRRYCRACSHKRFQTTSDP